MIKRYAWILILFVCCIADAQTPSFVWVRQGLVVGNPYNAASGRKIVTDASGNIYVTGDFDGPSLTLGSIVLNAPAGNNGALFVVKYDPLGNVLWAKTTDSCRSMGTGVALDGAGNLYLVGQYYFGNPYPATGRFGSHPFATGNGNMFLAQLDAATGNVNWMKQANATGSGNTSQGSAIAVYGTNEIYVSGTFNGMVNFGGTNYTSVGYYDAYVAKYNPAGNVVWVRTAGANGQTGFNALTTDNKGNVYVGGTYQSNLRIGTDTFTAAYKLVVAKYDANGNYKWARSSSGSATTSNFSKMAHDASNNIYAIGLYAVNNGTITFGNQSLTNTTGNYQTFLVKYDENGNVAWLKSPGGGFTSATYNPGIDIDKANNVYITGAYTGSATFGSTTITALVNGNTEDLYVARLDSSAVPVWAKSAGGNYADQSGDVAADILGNVIITGNSRSGNVADNVYFDTITVSVPSNQKYATVAKIGTLALVPPVEAAFVQGDSVICAGETVSFADQSSGSPDFWQWSFPGGTPSTSSLQNPTITYNTPGNHNVVLVAGNGADTDSMIKTGVITVHARPMPTVSAPDSIFCAGDSTQVCVEETYAAYTWNTSQTTKCIYVKNAGGYTATVTDASGCTASARKNVAVYPVPGISIIVQGDTLTSFNDSCQWYRNDTLIPGANSCTYIVRETGYYSVSTVDQNGCKARSSSVYVDVTAIEETGAGAQLTVYPNPSTGLWYIIVDNELVGALLQVYNIEGRLVYQSEIRNLQSEIAVNISPGMYYLKVQTEDRVSFKPLIRQ